MRSLSSPALCRLCSHNLQPRPHSP
uniref:Uncharacterized protein n=1 Tax=Arundo donax TaxID=35708 RepID=A0A0A9TXB0_ARUDO